MQGTPDKVMRDFDDNEFPLAYLITFRCYGTWLHGDSRRSVDRRRNVFGTPRISENSHLEYSDNRQQKHERVELDAIRRQIVEKAIRELCDCRKYLLRALNVRTNHVHSVITATCRPETVLNALKAYATRAMREAGALSTNIKPWSRHGSTIYLWKERDVSDAVAYVLFGQGDELFTISGD